MVLEDYGAGSIGIINNEIAMKLFGHRVLVIKIEEEQKEGFATVEIQDSFVNKGRVEQVSSEKVFTTFGNLITYPEIGDIILFAKYSPDTHEIEHEGKKMKIVRVEDILAIL